MCARATCCFYFFPFFPRFFFALPVAAGVAPAVVAKGFPSLVALERSSCSMFFRMFFSRAFLTCCLAVTALAFLGTARDFATPRRLACAVVLFAFFGLEVFTFSFPCAIAKYFRPLMRFFVLFRKLTVAFFVWSALALLYGVVDCSCRGIRHGGYRSTVQRGYRSYRLCCLYLVTAGRIRSLIDTSLLNAFVRNLMFSLIFADYVKVMLIFGRSLLHFRQVHEPTNGNNLNLPSTLGLWSVFMGAVSRETHRSFISFMLLSHNLQRNFHK